MHRTARARPAPFRLRLRPNHRLRPSLAAPPPGRKALNRCPRHPIGAWISIRPLTSAPRSSPWSTPTRWEAQAATLPSDKHPGRTVDQAGKAFGFVSIEYNGEVSQGVDSVFDLWIWVDNPDGRYAYQATGSLTGWCRIRTERRLTPWQPLTYRLTPPRSWAPRLIPCPTRAWRHSR